MVRLALVENTTLLGVHMIGNRLDIDPKGHIRQSQSHPLISHLISDLWSDIINPKEQEQIEEQNSINLVAGRIQSKQKIDLKATSNCWVCEGWTQIKFTFNPFAYEELINQKFKFICLHLDFDGYKPDLMTKNIYGTYTVIRMVPPTKIKFFYTVDGVKPYVQDAEEDIYTVKEDGKQVSYKIFEMVETKIPKSNIITKLM